VAGVPVVVELAKNIPELRAQVASFEEQLKVFISAFLEGPEWADDPQENPATAS